IRQGVSTLSLCLILIAIVGCGGSSGYKNSAGTLTSTNLATGSSSPAPGTTTTPGASSGSTGGSSAGSTTPTNPPAPPPVPATPAQIQTQPGWDNCDVCAGAAGNGPNTAHAMVEGVSSPSLSGAAARFDIGGTPWGAALFWRELGSHDEAQNLKYDLDFYLDSISSGQALEFDVNQTTGGSKYIFGTECYFRGS